MVLSRKTSSVRATSRAVAIYEDHDAPASELNHDQSGVFVEDFDNENYCNSGRRVGSGSSTSEGTLFDEDVPHGLNIFKRANSIGDPKRVAHNDRNISMVTAIHIDDEDERLRMLDLPELDLSDDNDTEKSRLDLEDRLNLIETGRGPNSFIFEENNNLASNDAHGNNINNALSPDDTDQEGLPPTPPLHQVNVPSVRLPMTGPSSTDEIVSSDRDLSISRHSRSPISSIEGPRPMSRKSLRQSQNMKEERRRTLSPFPPSPRSARHRLSNMSSTSSQSHMELETQRQPLALPGPVHPHPDPHKEYPLVLLHCNINALPPPWPESIQVSEHFLADLTLLARRLEGTTNDRGLLLQHPRASYSRLIESILEGLDLMRMSSHDQRHSPDVEDVSEHAESTTQSETSTNVVERSESNHDASRHEHKQQRSDPIGARTQSPDSSENCPSISRTLHHRPHEELMGNQRRWEVRVYALSGLMSRGAWRAAWRDMERIDVEIGVWVDDAQRRQWDLEVIANQARREQEAAQFKADSVRGMADLLDEEQTNESDSHADAAGTSADSGRNTCKVRGPQQHHTIEQELASYVEDRRIETEASQDAAYAPRQRLPLTTLLGRYLRRLVTRSSTVKWVLRTVVLVVVFRLGALFNSASSARAKAKDVGITVAVSATATGLSAAIESITNRTVDVLDIVSSGVKAEIACEQDGSGTVPDTIPETSETEPPDLLAPNQDEVKSKEEL